MKFHTTVSSAVRRWRCYLAYTVAIVWWRDALVTSFITGFG